MRRSAVIVALAICMFGCASEPERFEYSLAHARICPKAQRVLSRQDIVDIAHVVAHATRQPIAGITIPAKLEAEHKIEVITAYPGVMTMDSPSRELLGGCTLEKVGSTWTVIECSEGLSPGLAFTILSCVDSQ